MNAAELPDHASHADDRGVPIDRVGIRGLSVPITVWDRAHRFQHTVASIDAAVALPATETGTHMSRFVEVLGGVRGELSLKNLPDVLGQIQRRLGSDHAFLSVRFPYFIEKAAPVSGARSLMEYRAAFFAEKSGEHFDFVLEVGVPVTTLCPCSKAVSDRGAHNQRSWVTVAARAADFLWIEDLVEAIEACASCELFALLKRDDEKWVTERAYDHPRFVEDLIREVSLALQPRVSWMKVQVENLESIHNHSAWAELEWSPERPPETTAQRPARARAADFGAWLRGMRASHGWSQEALAARIGVSASLLSKVERNCRPLPSPAFAALAAALGVEEAPLRLRAGLLGAEHLAAIQADPEAFLAWAGG